MEKITKEFTDYLSHLGYAKVSTEGRHKIHSREFINYLKSIQVYEFQSVEVSHIISYRKYLETRPNKVRGGQLSETSIYNKMRTVQLLFEMLQAKGKITINPVSQIEIKIPRSQQRKTILTESEIERLYKVCADDKERSILSLAYGCGLRVGEMEKLQIKDIYFDDQYLIVQKGKGNKRRAVPMSTGVIKDLKSYYYHQRNHLTTGRDYNPKDKAMMLNKRGGRMREWTYNSTLRSLIERSESQEIKTKKIGMHNLRHSIATHLLHRGLDINQVRQFLGHVLLSTTQIYTHIDNKQIIQI